MNGIKNSIEELLAKDLQFEDNIEFQKLYSSALKFIANIQKYSNLFKGKKKYAKLTDEINAIYYLMKQDVGLTRQLILEGELFQSAVDEFLNRQTYLTYVRDNGEIIYYGETNTRILYQQAQANAGRGNIDSALIENINDLEEDVNKKLSKSVSKRREIYQSAVGRWYDKRGGARKHFYYFIGKKFHNSKLIRSKGRIAEAYVQLIVDEVGDNSNINLGLELLNNRIDIDNIPAVVQGDVYLKSDNGEVHFAVKEGSFSSAKLGPYYHLANNIIQMKKAPSVAEFKQALPKLVKTSTISEKIIQSINKEVEMSVENIVKKYSK